MNGRKIFVTIFVNMQDDNKYLHEAILNQLKETATTMYNVFSSGYENLNKDVEKAEKLFHDVLIQGDYVIKPMPFYNKSFRNLNRDEDIFYIIQILSLLTKASHNLWVIARHNKDDEELFLFQKREKYYQAELYFYYHLAHFYKVKKQIKEILDVYYQEMDISFYETAIGDMLLLEFSLSNDFFDNYYAYQKDLNKHWYTAYQRLNNLDILELDRVKESLAVLLNEHINEFKIQELLYHSVFYENLLLDYAYKHHYIDTINIIFNNGYDHYLEVDTLYILYMHDKDRFLSSFKELKTICLERLIAKCDEKGRNYNIVNDVFPLPFLKEVAINAKEALMHIDKNDSTDYRNRDERQTPEKFKR